MPDVPKGSLFLGDKLGADHQRANNPVVISASDLTTHAVIVGMTGSGKTGLGIVLIEECLLQGIPVIVIDPKGDMGNLLLAFPDHKPEDFAPYIVASEAAKAGRTVADQAAAVAQQWSEGQARWDEGSERVRALRDAANITIYTPGSTAGVPLNLIGDLRRPEAAADPEAVQDEIEGVVSSLLNLIGVESDPLSGREHILLANLIATAWAAGKDLDLATLVGQVQQPPLRKLGVIDIDTFFPPNDRAALALRLNGLLASPSFTSWTRGEPLDIGALLSTGGKPNAAIIEIAHLSDQERQFVVTLVLAKLVTWMRQQSGTPDLRALVYMDEVFGFVPPTAAPPAKKPILTIFKQARAFGVGMVLATQNPVDVDYKAIANAGTWMVGRLQTERDKARLLDGLRDAAGATDTDEVSKTIAGLDKREFLFHSTKADRPFTFTSRWTLSYLAGPLSREQISALMASRTVSVDAPAAAATVEPEAALGADESTLAPAIAAGVGVHYLDPAAAWAGTVGASPNGKRFEAAVVARLKLLFDDDKAGVREQQEWEAVFFPLDGALAPEEANHVDYDERDFRAAPPDGAIYTLPKADLAAKAFFTKARADLQDHLYRTQTVEIFTNAELRLFSRVGESREDFQARCAKAADEQADKDADKLRQQIAARSDRIHDAINSAEDRVRETKSDQSRRNLETVVSVAGGLLGSFLGGRKNTKSVLSTITRGVGRVGTGRQAGERAETAHNRLEGQQQELQELEDDLAEKLQAIQSEWDAKAAGIESITIPLEKTDITVDELEVVWIPVGP